MFSASLTSANSDLPADPSVVWGTLENGVLYGVMPNNEPPDRVSLRLYVKAGSLMETDTQAGLAHFLEHMAFNGSENYPPGELVEYLQRLGLGFGAHTNAYTSFDKTVYLLDLPENTDTLLREGLQVLRDQAGGLLLLEEEIERERGVILAEKRYRDSAENRTFEAQLKFLFPESLVAKRLPIGEEVVISQAQQPEFAALYQDWYTTDRLAVLVAGAVEPEKVIGLIDQYFGNLPQNLSPKEDPDLGPLPQQALTAMLHSEPELPATTILIAAVSEYSNRPDSRAKRIDDLKSTLANRILSRRLEILTKTEDAPFSKGSAEYDVFLKYADIAEIELTTTPALWEQALATGEQQLRKALRYGFTEAEIEEAKANLLQNYQQAARKAPTRNSSALPQSLIASISNDRVLTSPEEDLKIAQEAMDELTQEQVLAALRENWSTPNRNLFISGNLTLEDASAKIKEVFSQSMAVEVSPPQARETPAFAYTDLGAPGTVIEEVLAKDLGIYQGVFENGLRFNFKQTNYEASQVLVSVRFGGGKLAMLKALDGIALFGEKVFIAGGLEAHSRDELRRITAGRIVKTQFSVDSGAFSLTGETNRDDLELQLQLLAAYLSAPGYRPEAERLARKTFEQLDTQLTHTAEGVYQNQVQRFLAGGSYRFGYPPKAALMERTLDELRNWLQGPLSESYLEISIVGDVDFEQAKQQLASTLGALPKRAEQPEPFLKARTSIQFPKEHEAKTWSYETQIPRAIAAAFWPTGDFWDIDRTRTLNLLAVVFRDRLRLEVRQKLGEGYSPITDSQPSKTYEDYGYFMGLNFSNPDKAKEVSQIIAQISDDLASKNITEDELKRAVEPMLSQIAVLQRSNHYWLNQVLTGSSIHQEQLDFARSLPTAYAQISLEELNNHAEQYLGSNKAVTVVINPEEP